ncbi:hypothetical protein AAHE18_08G209800 [Arachis hypogaea]|uniref:Lunapark zinc ribbon domain-containing protein n=1 Tax=Arachis hypogaea TaxID=3818 RepID=A0A445C0L1_ARAHY|nr:uncharacterized protein At2g24330 isoform X1 [Arachis hypogaea]XP_025615532.1 uncharacterized protein At2g24330 isoform X1 [Arachis hypogaea]QHO32257.1 uncharacterized protein DS421_8g248290 [Arachis hypogaea]RYR44426.1 hypothetical protein Ahy_A08g040755 isoform A [Arachis hypogaea]
MADDKAVGEDEKKEPSTTATKNVRQKRRGFLSGIWNGLFRLHGDDFEKRLQYISKEEAAVLSRMKRRSRSWRQISWNVIVFSVILEVIAVVYAIMTTRSVDMNWKMRAVRVSPMFLLPVLASAAYSTFVSFVRICDRRDEKILVRLREERQAKIDELKEKTNYYTTQQLIQRYDPDPAAKAAAATVLASKLGAESGLRVYMGDELNPSATMGRSNDVELVQSSGLRNRKQPHARSSSSEATTPFNPDQQHLVGGSGGLDQTQTSEYNHLVVEHHQPQSSTSQDGGWLAKIAALLVGEDPTQSYALICGNCHMHNGLARKEDFPYVTYYCPHCHALNQPKQLDGNISRASPRMGSPKAYESEAVKYASGSAAESMLLTSNNPVDVIASATESTITSNSPVNASPEIEEVSERTSSEDKAD